MSRVVCIGTSIVECARIGHLIHRHEERFLRRVFTENEIRYCSARRASMQQYAARWAVKQAVFRAIRFPIKKGVPWTEIEVPNGQGPEFVRLSGAFQRLMQKKRIAWLLASWGFCRTFAVGFVIGFEKETEPPNAG